jgi:hypothetical protein
LLLGKKRIREGTGTTILQTCVIALLIGLVTPIIAMVTSILMLSIIEQYSTQSKCYSFVAGFIGIGILVEIILIPVITIVLKITEQTKRNIS